LRAQLLDRKGVASARRKTHGGFNHRAGLLRRDRGRSSFPIPSPSAKRRLAASKALRIRSASVAVTTMR
jgi:hypothetical protein